MSEPRLNNHQPRQADYPKAAVDVLIFSIRDLGLKIVLIKMKKPPFAGVWTLPGGLVRLNESIDQAAVRELEEKTGLKNVYLEQLYTFGDVKRDPLSRVISVAYFALINSEGISLQTTPKYSAIDWFNVKELPTLVYDHSEMLKVALQRLRAKLQYTNVVYNLLPPTFTLGELRRIYEIMLDCQLDKRNFCKKFLSLGLLKSTDLRREGPHRPAQLWSFKQRTPTIVEIL
ncbi:MAG: NUDIX hydrolase [Acidobacteria bacterium]|nr:NUDIX hydrolase [Acidobacteriota bacterium]MBI3656681.1 NUDIX hydrolase [Acidobacteriota bacterium]